MPASTPTPEAIVLGHAARPGAGRERLVASRGGLAMATLLVRPAVHPGGLAGQCVEVTVEADGLDHATRAAVTTAAVALLRERGVDTVLSGAGVDPAGFSAVGGRLLRELSSVFWRSGRVHVIAEAGSNWRMGNSRRDLAMARALIDVAVDAGADAVKFQTYRPETVYVANAGQSDYLADAGIKEDIRDIFADLAMPYDMVGTLADYCRAQGIAFMSTGFSPADFAAIDPFVAVHKLASYEISHVRLIELAARSGKPTVFSTGAAPPEDIAWAVEHFHANGGRDLCLMQCTAKYPAPMSSVNLGAIGWLRQAFGVPVGLSDHSRDPVTAPVGAVALGARCIEKHYTLHNALPGPDHAFAVTPDELRLMVAKIRETEAALGSGIKELLEEERELSLFARRGVQALTDIAAGDVLREGTNIDILRPGKQRQGVHPRRMAEIEGRRATRAIPAGDGVLPGDWQ